VSRTLSVRHAFCVAAYLPSSLDDSTAQCRNEEQAQGLECRTKLSTLKGLVSLMRRQLREMHSSTPHTQEIQKRRSLYMRRRVFHLVMFVQIDKQTAALLLAQ